MSAGHNAGLSSVARSSTARAPGPTQGTSVTRTSSRPAECQDLPARRLGVEPDQGSQARLSPNRARLRQVEPRVGIGNGHAVIVLATGDERPAIIFCPSRSGSSRRRHAGPGFSRCQVGAGKSIGAYHLRGFGGLSVPRRIDPGEWCSAGFAEVGLARGFFLHRLKSVPPWLPRGTG